MHPHYESQSYNKNILYRSKPLILRPGMGIIGFDVPLDTFQSFRRRSETRLTVWECTLYASCSGWKPSEQR